MLEGHTTSNQKALSLSLSSIALSLPYLLLPSSSSFMGRVNLLGYCPLCFSIMCYTWTGRESQSWHDGCKCQHSYQRVLPRGSLCPWIGLKPLIYFIGPFNSQERRTLGPTDISRTETNQQNSNVGALRPLSWTHKALLPAWEALSSSSPMPLVKK